MRVANRGEQPHCPGSGRTNSPYSGGPGGCPCGWFPRTEGSESRTDGPFHRTEAPDGSGDGRHSPRHPRHSGGDRRHRLKNASQST
jgi:hypothetical protein